MDTIKQAADSLLSKKEITQEEYNLLKDRGAFELKKEGNWAEFGTVLKNILWPIAAVGGTAAIVKETIIDPITQSNKIKNSYEMMQEKVPQLAEKDQDQMKDYFEVIKTFSPTAASNPLVAGALVNKMMEFGGVDHKLVQDLASIQAGVARPSVVEAVTQSAAKSLAGAPKDEK
jgi:hypothetical protein